MQEKEKTGEQLATEDKEHESAQPQEHEPEHESSEDISEEECDEAIAGLLADIEALKSDNATLRSELSELRELLAGHERDNEHTPRRVEGSDATGDVEPVERHWYFRRIGRD